ncbi:MAG: hypothetical protein IKD77_04545 [Bacilli bacterium]|nr:hypothetical protein [Bacilli bacterium]
MNFYYIGIPLVFGVIGIVVAIFTMNSLKVDKATVIQKKPGGVGKFWTIVFDIKGEKIELYTKMYRYNSVAEGDVVTIWHNGNYCARISKDN